MEETVKDLTVEERLIVAADLDPREFGGIKGARSQVIKLGKSLSGLGVVIKVNSILRAVGYSLIKDLQDLGLKVFADLKLVDIPKTMEYDSLFLSENPPDFLTVMCNSGVAGMSKVQKALNGKTDILGVTVLTSLDEEESQAIFTCSAKAGVVRFARMAQLAGLPGLILSPKEIEVIKKRKELVLTLNTPGIRPEWALVKGDDQSRVLTPKKAIVNGVTRIVVGRPITQAKDPYQAVNRTLDEIREALKEQKGE